MAVPLTTRAGRLGTVVLAAGVADAYPAATVQLVVALAGQGMIAYENAWLFARVQQLATTDPLTGVANRRHFFDRAGEHLEAAVHAGQPLAAMMVDIDRFKRINDTYGHRVGDEVIRTVAMRLRDNGRDVDLVGRYGGEEFAILLDLATADAAHAAERLRAAVADTPVATTAGPVAVTISIGVASLRPAEVDISDLLTRADMLMYEAKAVGRNRVKVG